MNANNGGTGVNDEIASYSVALSHMTGPGECLG